MSETLPSPSLSELDARSGLLSAMLVLFFFPFRVFTGKSSLLKNCSGGLDLVFIRSLIAPVYDLKIKNSLFTAPCSNSFFTKNFYQFILI